MTSKELFVAGARLLGLWQLLCVIDYAVGAFNLSVGFYVDRSISVQSYYTCGSTHLLTGLYLLGGAPYIVRFFYPPVSDASDSKPPTDAAND
jgi:hypothetical protein